jgi:hypothetical protein
MLVSVSASHGSLSSALSGNLRNMAPVPATRSYHGEHLSRGYCVCQSYSQSQSYIKTDGQSVSKSWCRAQSGTLDQRYIFFQSYCLVFFGGALSDERSSLSFVSLCQYSLQWSVSIYINYLHFVLHTFHN